MHIFRFSADKIIKYWDITQSIPENTPNAGEHSLKRFNTK